jgi:hypothetical protein
VGVVDCVPFRYLLAFDILRVHHQLYGPENANYNSRLSLWGTLKMGVPSKYYQWIHSHSRTYWVVVL